MYKDDQRAIRPTKYGVQTSKTLKKDLKFYKVEPRAELYDYTFRQHNLKEEVTLKAIEKCA